jgi:hypothetical protein
MDTQSILEDLKKQGIIPGEQAAQILEYETSKPFSVHWEVRSLLYLGITLLTSGLGVLIYKNIDTIGHQAIIALIATLVAGCFYYVIKHRQPFRWEEVDHSTTFSAYTLLLGCSLFLLLEGYLQFQYKVFGDKYGLAVFIPTVLFFILAYRFDHRGILSLAITGLASWLGLTISPLAVLEKNDFTAPGITTTGIVLGAALIIISWLSETRALKKHFAFTYLLFGGNLAILASMIGLFTGSPKIVYFLLSILFCTYLIEYARKTQSMIFLLMGVVYGYITLTYAAFKALPDTLTGFLSIYYFLFTSIGVILFLLNVKKILGLKK